MKKIVRALLVLALCVTCVFFAVACRRHPIDNAVKKMEEANSYKMTVEMSAAEFGESIKIDMLIKVDGDWGYVTGKTIINGKVEASTHAYVHKKGKKTTTYVKDSSGEYIATTQEIDEYGLMDGDWIYDLLDSDNYKEVEDEKSTYELKRDVEIEIGNDMEVEDAYLIINSDKIKLYVEVEYEGIDMDLTMIVSDTNDTKVSLPKALDELDED